MKVDSTKSYFHFDKIFYINRSVEYNGATATDNTSQYFFCLIPIDTETSKYTYNMTWYFKDA